jgi:predicted membrane metal-binding protein
MGGVVETVICFLQKWRILHMFVLLYLGVLLIVSYLPTPEMQPPHFRAIFFGLTAKYACAGEKQKKIFPASYAKYVTYAID